MCQNKLNSQFKKKIIFFQNSNNLFLKKCEKRETDYFPSQCQCLSRSPADIQKPEDVHSFSGTKNRDNKKFLRVENWSRSHGILFRLSALVTRNVGLPTKMKQQRINEIATWPLVAP